MVQGSVEGPALRDIKSIIKRMINTPGTSRVTISRPERAREERAPEQVRAEPTGRCYPLGARKDMATASNHGLKGDESREWMFCPLLFPTVLVGPAAGQSGARHHGHLGRHLWGHPCRVWSRARKEENGCGGRCRWRRTAQLMAVKVLPGPGTKVHPG